METKTTEHNELIAGALEAWFQKTQQKAEFRLAPLDSKLYVIRQQEEEILPEEPQQYSLYGEFNWKQGA
jgi:hypothetical protein